MPVIPLGKLAYRSFWELVGWAYKNGLGGQFFGFVLDKVLHSPGCFQTHYIGEAGLDLLILLSLPDLHSLNRGGGVAQW